MQELQQCKGDYQTQITQLHNTMCLLPTRFSYLTFIATKLKALLATGWLNVYLFISVFI